MSGLGGAAPLPLRLGGAAPTSGVSAQAYCRLAADTVAASRSLPFARLTITRATGGASPVLVKWSCRSPETSGNLPTITGAHPNPIVITFPKAPTDVFDDPQTLQIHSARVSRHNTSTSDRCLVTITAPNVITLDPDDSAAFDFTVSVYATWNRSKLEDYGAATDKENTATEVVPYAWLWYHEIGASLGSAYGLQLSGLVHSKKMAAARGIAALTRHEEQARNASTPHTAHPAALDIWADVLSVPVSADDKDEDVRKATAARFAAKSGQDLVELEVAVSELLGDLYVGITVFTDADPDGTWPDTYDLGAGVWASTQSKILVDVISPPTISDPVFHKLMNVQFVRLMDRLTPAWVWFDWTDTSAGGFYLDVSPLDFTGL